MCFWYKIGQKKFCSKKFWSKKICGPKNCGPKKILVWENFWSEKNFNLRKSLVQKNFSPKKNLVQFFFAWWKPTAMPALVPKNYGWKDFPKNVLWLLKKYSRPLVSIKVYNRGIVQIMGNGNQLQCQCSSQKLGTFQANKVSQRCSRPLVSIIFADIF